MNIKKIIAFLTATVITATANTPIFAESNNTRGQAIADIYAIMQDKHINSQESGKVLSDFSDSQTIADAIKPAAEWAVKYGVLRGFEDKSLKLSETITADEYSALLSRAKQLSDNSGGNYTDDMKIPKTYDFDELYGADAIERDGDHKNSGYFSNLDFYNAKSSKNLTILHNFKTFQQTSEVTCGQAAAEMVMNWYGMLGDNNERTMWDSMDDHSDKHMGTCLKQMEQIYNKAGDFEYTDTFDYKGHEDDINANMIKYYLEQNVPVMVCWNDFGGHWQVIIGYDDMGTKDYDLDDVIIVADPYDCGDHNQDGYGVYQWARFIYNYSAYTFFGNDEINDKIFMAAYPKNYDVPDYSKAEAWMYNGEDKDKDADLFIVAPTVYGGDETHFNQAYHNNSSNEKMLGAINMELGIYDDNLNIYSPYYRQMSLSAVGNENEDEALNKAYVDVKSAFEYYMANNNNGKPFVLAGFSQGSMLIKRLIEDYPQYMDKMIACYAIGEKFTEEEYEKYPQMKPAQNADDTGVVISFNTEAENVQDSFIVPKGEKAVAINPLNWKTDSTIANKSENKGGCFTNYNGEITKEINNCTGAYIDSQRGTLKATDIKSEDYPPFLSFITEGVYHIYDYQFFYRNLEENVNNRIEKYFEQNG